jgi:hypothetical protein
MSCYWQDAIERNAGRTIAEAKGDLQHAWLKEFYFQLSEMGAQNAVGRSFPERNTLHINVAVDTLAIHGLEPGAKSFALVSFSCANVHPRTAAQAIVRFSKTVHEGAA